MDLFETGLMFAAKESEVLYKEIQAAREKFIKSFYESFKKIEICIRENYDWVGGIGAFCLSNNSETYAVLMAKEEAEVFIELHLRDIDLNNPHGALQTKEVDLWKKHRGLAYPCAFFPEEIKGLKNAVPPISSKDLKSIGVVLDGLHFDRSELRGNHEYLVLCQDGVFTEVWGNR